MKSVPIDQIQGEISKRDFKEFVKQFWQVVQPGSPFVPGFHIDAIADHLSGLAKRDIRNLLINMPPRCGKSTIACVLFPAWQWLQNPAEQFFYTSYSLARAEHDSHRCRQLIQSDLFQKCYNQIFKLSEVQNTKAKFENDKNGYRMISSIAAGVTGAGADILACDDPHNTDETESDLKLGIASNWFSDVFMNRINDPRTGVRLVIGQRIHNEDLSGFILENYKEHWCHLCLPWEYKSTLAKPTTIGWTDPRTEEGQPLWPERFPPESIAQLKKKPKVFSAQYNQMPLNNELALFRQEQFRYYDEKAASYRCDGREVAKEDCFTVIAADLAISQSKGADYTAIIVAQLARSGEIILLDMVRKRMPGTQIVPTLKELNALYAPDYLLVEDVGFQKSLIDQGRAEGLVIRQVKSNRTTGNKEIRSYSLQVKMESGHVWFPRDRIWLTQLEKELVEFPEGTFDDCVDALSTLAAESAKRTRGYSSPVEEPEARTQEEIILEALHQGLY